MKTPPSSQKLRGGYYTPEALAAFLVEWAIQSPSAEVLEPSSGDGVFLEAAARRLHQLGARPSAIARQITAAEVDRKEAASAEHRVRAVLRNGAAPDVHRGDFFQLASHQLGTRRFDAIVGNPPFIRYQHFPEAHRETAFSLMRAAGLHPNRLTNAWLPFIAVCTELLADHGRLAMVVPAELLQVNYAAEIRRFLSERCHRLTVFTFRRLLFESVQQEVVLLCAERDGSGTAGIRTIELEDVAELADYVHTPFDRQDLKPMDHSAEKWTQYFLTKQQIGLLREMRGNAHLTALGAVADVEVGVVTGLNDFFVLSREMVEAIEAAKYTLPLVSRSAHLEGAVFTKQDWRRNAEGNLPAYLLTLPGVDIARLPRQAAAYVRAGEEQGWHKGYKCRIRSPWYLVPSLWVPDGFMLRQIHDRPRIMVNLAGATSTDTIHRVRMQPKADVKRLAVAAYNSLTFAFSEVVGRSYGGGVLELEPREARQLPIPYEFADRSMLSELDALIRDGRGDDALDYCDDVLLRKGLGLSQRQVGQLRRIWERLRDRRTGRRFAPSRSPEAQAVP
jgi:adenine-specific DNA-methyltransferase